MSVMRNMNIVSTTITGSTMSTTSAMGTMTPAFGILPSNVPNMALFGAIESIHGIRLSYGEYLLRRLVTLDGRRVKDSGAPGLF